MLLLRMLIVLQLMFNKLQPLSLHLVLMQVWQHWACSTLHALRPWSYVTQQGLPPLTATSCHNWGNTHVQWVHHQLSSLCDDLYTMRLPWHLQLRPCTKRLGAFAIHWRICDMSHVYAYRYILQCLAMDQAEMILYWDFACGGYLYHWPALVWLHAS